MQLYRIEVHHQYQTKNPITKIYNAKIWRKIQQRKYKFGKKLDNLVKNWTYLLFYNMGGGKSCSLQ